LVRASTRHQGERPVPGNLSANADGCNWPNCAGRAEGVVAP